jgi:protein O-mannosyl-transferase
MQVHVNDIKHLIQTIASGKTPSLATSWWPSEATRRLVVICLSTLGLLFARLHIMGSQLPVFTRYDQLFDPANQLA